MGCSFSFLYKVFIYASLATTKKVSSECNIKMWRAFGSNPLLGRLYYNVMDTLKGSIQIMWSYRPFQGLQHCFTLRSWYFRISSFLSSIRCSFSFFTAEFFLISSWGGCCCIYLLLWNWLSGNWYSIRWYLRWP